MDKKTILERRKERIYKAFEKSINKSFSCSAVKSDVKITKDSVKETANHACKDEYSTRAACRIVEALKSAILIKEDAPHNKTQREKFKFVKMYELKSMLKNIGTVKIIIGKKRSGFFVHYCITKKWS